MNVNPINKYAYQPINCQTKKAAKSTERKIKPSFADTKNASKQVDTIKISKEAKDKFTSLYQKDEADLTDIPWSTLSAIAGFSSGKIVEKNHLEELKACEIQSDFEPNYSDTKAFSEYFSQKIDKTLKVRTKEEIDTAVKQISQSTGAEISTVKQTMARLSQFSGYGELKTLGEELSKLGVKKLYFNEKNLSINNALRYLEYRKQQLELNPKGTKRALVLDDFTIEMLKDMKKNSIKEFNNLKKSVDLGNTIIVQVDGWNATVDGKDISHTIFGGQGNIFTSTAAAIKALKSGENPNEVFNGNLKAQAQEIFGEDTQVHLIKNPNAKKSDTENLSKLIAPIRPNAEEIQIALDTIVENSLPEGEYSKEEIQKAKELLSKYYDSMITCYSGDSMTSALMKQYNEIEAIMKKQGKTMDDVIYVCPRSTKSFDVVTYQYAKANNIDKSKIVYWDGQSEPKQDFKDKTLVILDDIVGSGNSMLFQEFAYAGFEHFCKNKNTNVIFAPLTSLESGYQHIKDEIADKGREGKDFIIPDKRIDFEGFKSSLTPEEDNLLTKVLAGYGFSDGGACTVMPYMIPDNDSPAAFVLAQMFLAEPDAEAVMCKCFEPLWVTDRDKEIREKLQKS